jgi:hypothetical protein
MSSAGLAPRERETERALLSFCTTSRTRSIDLAIAR